MAICTPSMGAITSSIFSASMASTAAMEPMPTGTASCISIPLCLTVLIASSADITPAATIAGYSPRLKPAATSGFTPVRSFKTSIIAMLAVTIAACVYSVMSSLSLGVKQSSGMENPKSPLAISKIFLPVSVCS